VALITRIERDAGLDLRAALSFSLKGEGKSATGSACAKNSSAGRAMQNRRWDAATSTRRFGMTSTGQAWGAAYARLDIQGLGAKERGRDFSKSGTETTPLRRVENEA